MLIYIKLLFYQKKYLYKNFKLLLIKDLLKYIFFMMIIIQSFFLISTLNEFLNKISFVQQIKNGNILITIIVIAIFAAHFSIKLTTPLSFKPFWRFGSNNQFFLKSYIYPLFSSDMFLIFLTMVITFGKRGIIYFTLFYIVYLSSYKMVFVRVVMIGSTIFSHLFFSNEIQILSFTVLMISAIIFYDWQKSKKISTKKNRKISTPLFQSLIVKKEIAYYKYFTSEQYYFIIGILIYFLLFNYISTLSASDSPLFFMFFVLFMSCLPFIMTLFNLFGMDTNALDRFFRHPTNTIDYQLKRLRIYELLMIIFHIFFGISFSILYKDISVFIEYMIISFVFVEALISISFLYSICLIEQKEIRFRYGQYLKSKNFKFLQLVQIGLVVFFFFTYYFFKIEGIIVIGILVTIIDIFHIKYFALKIMEFKRVKGSYEKFAS